MGRDMSQTPKTPDNVAALKEAAAQIRAGLGELAQTDKFTARTEVGVVHELLEAAEGHFEDADPHGYFPTEEHAAHLDAAAAYAALAKAGARALAVRLEDGAPPA
jgi:hypothetical protein